MKRVEIIFDETRENEIMMILRQSGATNYTRLNAVLGDGSSGPRLNNAVGPGQNSMLILVLEDAKADRVLQSVKRYKQLAREEGGHAATRCVVSPVSEFV